MLEWMQQLLQKFGQLVTQVLPLSPFRSYIDNFDPGPGLSWLNWFVPVADILSVLAAWLAAYALYLLYRIILRWIKAVS